MVEGNSGVELTNVISALRASTAPAACEPVAEPVIRLRLHCATVWAISCDPFALHSLLLSLHQALAVAPALAGFYCVARATQQALSYATQAKLCPILFPSFLKLLRIV